MLRVLACALAFVGVVALVGVANAQTPKQNQMVKGTVKSINVEDGVLIVLQKVKDETVERQLDIKGTTEFTLTVGGEKIDLTGKDGLAKLTVGSQVQVKCDKDVNVLKVTGTVK
jgi:hypothetical protein